MRKSDREAPGISRRGLLKAAGLGTLTAGLGGTALASMAGVRPASAAEPRFGPRAAHSSHDGVHAMGTVGEVDTARFDPMAYLRAWNFSHLPVAERARFYRESPLPDGTTLREYEIFAANREIEIAPNVYFPAWTYNGQVPGPTLRATEGDTVRVRFVNQGDHPHTIHFHGWHHPEMDGSMPDQQVDPGEAFHYEFIAEPFGLHLYHCHTVPLKRHIHKGLYGVFLVDPPTPRPPADELVMVMNGFDTDFDSENEVYAVNSVAFFHMQRPVVVRLGELVRIYVVNLTEFDPINSFHIHAVFFDVYRTGTRLETTEHTDNVMFCQAERAILETRFRYPGQFMFHAHQSEFAELGWMGLFDVRA